MRISLITGASSGLGREFALIADRSGKYDEIWAVARRKDRLEALAKECETPVRALSIDLSQADGIDALESELARAKEACAKTTAAGSSVGPVGQAAEKAAEEAPARSDSDGFVVGQLINAAGFAKLGTFESVSRKDRDGMIDLNCRALVDITAAVVPYMAKGSRIIEVASMAGFLPLPHLNIYAATKAFVVSYTRSLRWELAGTGIHATALCPQWMRTEFESVSRQTQRKNDVRHQQPSISPRRAARWSLIVNACNLPVATCGLYAFVVRVVAKVIPNPILMAFWEGFRRI